MVIGLIVLGMVPLGIDEMIRFFKSEKFLKGSDINYDSGSNGFKNHRQKAAVYPESPTFLFSKGKINLGRKTCESWASAANHRFPKGFWESYENSIRKFNERHSEKSNFTTADLFKHRGISNFISCKVFILSSYVGGGAKFGYEYCPHLLMHISHNKLIYHNKHTHNKHISHNKHTFLPV